MKKTILKFIRIILGGILMLSLFGCSVNKYEIDYCGAKSSYQGAKSSYEPGVEVKLYYKNFASDMEYSFYIGWRIYSAGVCRQGSGYPLCYAGT